MTVNQEAYEAVLAAIAVTAGTDPGSVVTCGECGRQWDDSVITSLTPAPAARCPYEYIHEAIPTGYRGDENYGEPDTTTGSEA
jgi:hypothetical protein